MPEPAVSKAPELAAPEHDEGDEGDADEPEPFEAELHADPFESDLDADGRPESISWTCTTASAELRVGQAKYSPKLGFSELMGCVVAVVDLDPHAAGSQLWLHADEHDEVGPNRNFFLRHAGGELEAIWEGDSDFELFIDGSWRTEASECVEAQRLVRTTTTVWRWREARVIEEATVSTTPMAADERCDVEAEP